MRRYSQADEERIRAQTLVREWTRSKVLDPSQCARFEAELRVDVRRTNVFLRAGLALFTVLIVGASVLFVIKGFEVIREIPTAVVTGAAALACIGLAEVLAGQYRFYRFGVEEALAIGSVVLLAISGAGLISAFHSERTGEAMMVAGLLIGAAGGFGVYRRFGFVYAAVGAMACAAAIPFQLQVLPVTRHVQAVAILAAVFAVARSKRLQYQDDHPGDEYGQLQAAAWAGLYLTLNLHLGWGVWEAPIVGWFYWCTYVITWVMPIVGLGLGIRERDRALIDVSLVIALVTLVTNKPYLGSPRHTWDPILLGVFLAVVALGLRRWLSNGPNGERRGFTPSRILDKDSAVLTLLSAAAAAMPPGASQPGPAPAAEPVKPHFDGGRSGGAGGGARY
jgi:hypothetical protein